MTARHTSKPLASLAAAALQDEEASERERSLAGSVLAQAEDEPAHRSHRREGSLKVPGERWPERKTLQAAE